MKLKKEVLLDHIEMMNSDPYEIADEIETSRGNFTQVLNGTKSLNRDLCGRLVYVFGSAVMFTAIEWRDEKDRRWFLKKFEDDEGDDYDDEY